MTKKIYSEKLVDKYLVACVEKRGGLIFKMHPITNAGIPDRLIHYSQRTFYVETQATGKQCTPLQIEMHKRLKDKGIDTYVLDTKVLDLFDIWNVCYTTYEGRHYAKNPFKT